VTHIQSSAAQRCGVDLDFAVLEIVQASDFAYEQKLAIRMTRARSPRRMVILNRVS
jgi:hypothetical protein